MAKIFWADLIPLAAAERDRLRARLDKLAKIEREADKANRAFAQINTPEQLRIRPGFAIRSQPADAYGDPPTGSCLPDASGLRPRA